MSTVTLHLVSYIQPEKLLYRTFEYERKNTMLVAVETGNEEKSAPYGLKRVRLSDLPKVGGILGTAAVGHTRREARAAVLRVLENRAVAARRDLDCWEKGISAVLRDSEAEMKEGK